MPHRINRASIDRALENAKRRGWVDRWERHIEGGYIVHIRRWGAERFSNREANAFALGMAAVSRNSEQEEEA